ncbi:MAG: cupin domain-containing protein, partial [Actinomycetia bacterium]|nr:cupin domain-containing protein [Actinomycetes bacterium]
MLKIYWFSEYCLSVTQLTTRKVDMTENEPAPPGLKPQPEVLMSGIGSEVKRLRKDRNLTLDALSREAKVSIGLISQIERGRGNPSFNTLVQVAHALNVPIGRLFHTADDPSPVVRANERRVLDTRSTGVDALHELLTPSLRGALEVVSIEAPPGYDTSETPFTHPGEEFGLVLTGVHEVTVGGVTYQLGPGDSITYSSTVPHSYHNPGPDVVRAIW